jgi:hypothetical protein
MNRHWLLALAAGLMLPTVAAAQLSRGPIEENWSAKLRVTPYVGFSPSFKSSGTRAVYTGGAEPMLYSEYYQFDYAAGPVTGLLAEFKLAGRFNAIASIAWNNRNHTTMWQADGSGRIETGSQFWLAKVGGSVRMLEAEPDMQMRRVNASVFFAGAVIREVPETSLFSSSNFTTPAQHFGANFGAQAELPFVNRKLAFEAAVEDFMVFWSADALNRRFENEILNAYGPEAVAEVAPSRSNFLVARVGLVFRFGL